MPNLVARIPAPVGMDTMTDPALLEPPRSALIRGFLPARHGVLRLSHLGVDRIIGPGTVVGLAYYRSGYSRGDVRWPYVQETGMLSADRLLVFRVMDDPALWHLVNLEVYVPVLERGSDAPAFLLKQTFQTFPYAQPVPDVPPETFKYRWPVPRVRACQFGDAVYWCMSDGSTLMRFRQTIEPTGGYEVLVSDRAGLEPPSASAFQLDVVPSGRHGVAGTLTAGETYYYAFTYLVRDADFDDTLYETPHLLRNVTLSATDTEHHIQITVRWNQIPPSVRAVCIYRCPDGGSVPYRIMPHAPLGLVIFLEGLWQNAVARPEPPAVQELHDAYEDSDVVDMFPTGDALGTLEPPPPATIVTSHRNRLVIADGTWTYGNVTSGGQVQPTREQRNLIAFSNLGSPRHWGAGLTGFPTEGISLAIGADDTQPITGIASLGAPLMVWTPNQRFLVSGSSGQDFQVELVDNVGCQCHDTIASLGHLLLWLGKNEVYVSGAAEGFQATPAARRIADRLFGPEYRALFEDGSRAI